jgi:hypothetical protein
VNGTSKSAARRNETTDTNAPLVNTVRGPSRARPIQTNTKRPHSAGGRPRKTTTTTTTKTVADFSQSLANLHDRFGHEIQMLVETFRKRNGELRKER